MKKRIRFTDQEVLEIVSAYQDRMEKVESIAKKYGVSRPGIYKVLKRMEIDTSKGGPNVVLFVTCTACGESVPKYRSEIRRSKHAFCSTDCVKTYQKHGAGKTAMVRKHGLEVARVVASQHFALRPENVVHQENDNAFDNSLGNLKVFRTQGDHVRYHQGAVVPILWDGATI